MPRSARSTRVDPSSVSLPSVVSKASIASSTQVAAGTCWPGTSTSETGVRSGSIGSGSACLPGPGSCRGRCPMTRSPTASPADWQLQPGAIGRG
jgi:hypothetical protein